MRRVLATMVVILSLVASRADAVTVKEIIELTRAGLSEEVLLALIEVDQRVFSIDTETLKELQAAGVGERVIVALVRSGRERPVEPPLSEPEPAPVAPPPQVVVIEHEPVVREVAVPVAVPVYVPVVTRAHRRRADVPVNPAVPRPLPPFGSFEVEDPDPHVRHAAPVYWGWGGKLRPDAWKPTPNPSRPPDK